MKRQAPISRACGLLALLSLAFVPSAVCGMPADPPYAVTSLGVLDSGHAISNPNAINASGDVVGQSFVRCGGGLLFVCARSFLYAHSTGLMTQLGVLGAGTDQYYSTAFGINASGDAVGSSAERPPDASYPGRAILYPAGGGMEFLPPTTTPSVALAELGGFAGCEGAK